MHNTIFKSIQVAGFLSFESAMTVSITAPTNPFLKKKNLRTSVKIRVLFYLMDDSCLIEPIQ